MSESFVFSIYLANIVATMLLDFVLIRKMKREYKLLYVEVGSPKLYSSPKHVGYLYWVLLGGYYSKPFDTKTKGLFFLLQLSFGLSNVLLAYIFLN